MIKRDAASQTACFSEGTSGEIDLKQLFSALLRRFWLILTAAAVCAAVCFSVPPRCTGTVVFYTGNATLVDTYMVLLDTHQTLSEIGKAAGVEDSVRHLRALIRAERVQSAELFRVTVTDSDPLRTRQLTEAVASVLPGQIGDLVDADDAKVVDLEDATRSGILSGRTLNALAGFAAGLCLATGIVLLHLLLDDSICSRADVEAVCLYPVLARISEERDAADAFIRLRTQLAHLLPASSGRIIAVCGICEEDRDSPAQLAFSLSRQGRRVLLIDCDLRRFSEDARPGGLSGFLSGRCGADKLIRCCGIPGHEKAFHVLSAGKNPPNPSELLCGSRMARLLRKLRTVYDDVILCLPDLQDAADALVAAAHTDGMLLTARKNRCTRTQLSDALRQLEAVDAPILGIVQLPEKKR